MRTTAKRLLIILCLIFSVNSFAQNNQEPKSINEEINIPEGNTPENTRTSTGRIGTDTKLGRMRIAASMNKAYNDKYGDVPNEVALARDWEDIQNEGSRKGIKLRGRTQNYSNDAFVVPKDKQSKFDNGINRYNSRGQQEINDYRSKKQDEFAEKKLYGWLALLVLILIFLLRISFRKEIKKEPSSNISDDSSFSDINLLNNDIPKPLYSNYKGEELEKQLIKKYSFDYFDFCYNHYASPGITSNILCSTYYSSILPKAKEKDYESALWLINYRNQTLKELFDFKMPMELQQILAERYYDNIALLIYAQCYYEDITAGNDLFLRNINELIYKCIEIRHNQNCIYQKDIENIEFDFSVIKRLENLILSYII